MGLHYLLHLRGLLMECHRSGRRLVTGKEVGAVSALHGSSPISAGMETFMSWHHRQVAGHHLPLTERSCVNTAMVRSDGSVSKIRGPYRSDSRAHTSVGLCQANVGTKRPVAPGQWTDEALTPKPIMTETSVVKEAMSVAKKEVKTDGVVAIEARAIPGEERIARSHRQPAERAESEAHTVSKAKKGHKCRGPHRTIRGIHRAWPPRPCAAIEKPAAIVIRRPSPGLIRNPGPAIIRVPNPAACLIRRPVRTGSVRLPNIAVTRSAYPVTIGIQVLCAGVISVGATPAFGVTDDVVAIAVEAVPVIFGRGIHNFVFRTALTANGDEL